MALLEPRPYQKDSQVGAGRPKKYRRKVASPKQWAAIRADKLDVWLCRICFEAKAESLHHLVSRAQGGDDVPDNLVGLCGSGTTGCHGDVESRKPDALKTLSVFLSDAEYAYCVSKLGENALERLFGVTYQEAT